MFLVWDTVSVSTKVYTLGSPQEIRSGFDLSLGHGLDSKQGFYFGFMTRNSSGISLFFLTWDFVLV